MNPLIEALNTNTYKTLMLHGIDRLIVFYSNEGCSLCGPFWPVLDRAVTLYEKYLEGNSPLNFGLINMNLNEITYIETWGSLPNFYPIVRYFHSKTHTIRDFQNVGTQDYGKLL